MSNAKESRIEILDVRDDDCYKTGLGQTFATATDARYALRQWKQRYGAPRFGGDFLVDLYVGDTLEDSFALTADGFTQLTGELPKSHAEYAAYDQTYHGQALALARAMVEASPKE